MLQVQRTNSERPTVLIPQTAVCGYFKSSLLGHANPMANAVPEPTLSRRRLDLNKSTNCRLEDCSSFPAVLTFARASKAYRTLIDKRPVPDFQSQQLKHLEIVVFTTGEVGIKHSLHFFGLEDPAASYGFF